jgi:predicted metal-binding membrane protein
VNGSVEERDVRPTPSNLIVALSVAAASAWFLALSADLTGAGPLLHHHALIEGGSLGAPPLWLAVPLALLSWQLMVAAMMVPASLPAFDVFERTARTLGRPALAVAAFLSAFAVVWALFGLAAFFGHFALHHVVDATPWLAAHPWLIQAGSFVLAGAYQFTPLKHRGLAACRQPMAGDLVGADGTVGLRAGWAHALDCVGASGPLMLLMFAAGFANLVWMALLTMVMVYEARGRAGHRAATVVGVVLIACAVTALALGGLPGWGSA